MKQDQRPSLRMGIKTLAAGLLLGMSIQAWGAEDLKSLPAHSVVFGADQYVRGAVRKGSFALERENIEGQAFERALMARLRPEYQGNPWHAEATLPIPRVIPKGQTLMVRFWARGDRPGVETNDARLTVVHQLNRGPWSKSLNRTVELGAQWREYAFAWRSALPFDANESALSFMFGHYPQTVMIGAVELMLFEDAEVRPEDLPVSPPYDGSAADAAWRKGARERIEKHRMGDLHVEVLEPDGRPVAATPVHLRMERHAFRFSCAVDPYKLLAENEDGANYRRIVLELFNSLSPANNLKMPAWVGDWGEKYQRQRTLDQLKWMIDHGFTVRGHTLFWPSFRNSSREIGQLRESNPSAIPRRIDEHIRDILQTTDGFILEWDVLNEPRAHTDFEKLFGREVLARWVQVANEAAPDLPMVINDYAIINGGGPGSHNHEYYKDVIRFLQGEGVRLGGIGFQSHIGASLPGPDHIWNVLDDFASLGLPLQITELDVPGHQDPQLQADYLRDFLTIAFSHPAVNLIQIWGIWEGDMWRRNCALIDPEWNERPAVDMLRHLLQEQWATNGEWATDPSGGIRLRAFHGDYRAWLQHEGRYYSWKIEHNEEGHRVRLTLSEDHLASAEDMERYGMKDR